jgi:hypothetical protein
MQDSTRPRRTTHFDPHIPSAPSRLAHHNYFDALSFNNFPKNLSHPTLFSSPFSLDLNNFDSSPVPVQPSVTPPASRVNCLSRTSLLPSRAISYPTPYLTPLWASPLSCTPTGTPSSPLLLSLFTTLPFLPRLS